MIKWLQEWFYQLCDREWEHENSILIETIDNPGWSIKIDLNNVNFSISSQKWKIFELSNENWVGYKVENNIFFAAGDPLKLETLIIIFKVIIENGIVEDSFIFNIMES